MGGQASHSPLELGGTGDTHGAFLRAFLLSMVRHPHGIESPLPSPFPTMDSAGHGRFKN